MAIWTKITENKSTGEITALVTVGGSVVTVIGYNWQWILNIFSTVFGIK